ncbi:hypothetical protein J6590_039207, partial [Homalodisca vitripennis]
LIFTVKQRRGIRSLKRVMHRKFQSKYGFCKSYVDGKERGDCCKRMCSAFSHIFTNP